MSDTPEIPVPETDDSGDSEDCGYHDQDNDWSLGDKMPN